MNFASRIRRAVTFRQPNADLKADVITVTFRQPNADLKAGVIAVWVARYMVSGTAFYWSKYCCVTVDPLSAEIYPTRGAACDAITRGRFPLNEGKGKWKPVKRVFRRKQKVTE